MIFDSLASLARKKQQEVLQLNSTNLSPSTSISDVVPIWNRYDGDRRYLTQQLATR